MTTIGYDLRSRRTSVQYANGVTEEIHHDPVADHLDLHRINGPGGVLREVELETDRVGNVLLVRSPDPNLTAEYHYDDLYRLVDATCGTDSFTYRYDDAGNLTHKSDVGDFQYGQAGQPATCLTSAGADTFGYDGRGCVTAAPWGTQDWDAFGRLIRITGADGTVAAFDYDHTGLRVSATLTPPAGPTRRVLTPDPLFAVEDGTLVAIVGGSVRRRADGSTAFLHLDHLGSLALVTGQTGAVVERRRYDPYGALLARTGPDRWPPVRADRLERLRLRA